MHNEKVSIIIPSYNRKELLSKCLASVKDQDYIHKEIIIIDDGSTDGTSSYIKENFPDVKIIRNPKPVGPAFAKNQGIINSDGQYVHFLDSDTELISRDAISSMVRFIETDKSTGALGGIAEMGTQGTIGKVYGRRITEDGRSYAISLNNAAIDVFIGGFAECDFVESCNCFTRRDILLKAGGFDPYYIYMGEDKELGIKIRRLGYKIIFSFKSACLHRYDEGVCFDRRFMYLRTRMRFAIKNKGLGYFFIIPILDFLFFFVYYPGLFLLRKIFPNLKIGKFLDSKTHPSVRLPPKKWLFLSVYYFLKVYILTLKELPFILRSRNFSFLSEKSLEICRNSIGNIGIWLER